MQGHGIENGAYRIVEHDMKHIDRDWRKVEGTCCFEILFPHISCMSMIQHVVPIQRFEPFYIPSRLKCVHSDLFTKNNTYSYCSQFDVMPVQFSHLSFQIHLKLSIEHWKCHTLSFEETIFFSFSGLTLISVENWYSRFIFALAHFWDGIFFEFIFGIEFDGLSCDWDIFIFGDVTHWTCNTKYCFNQTFIECHDNFRIVSPVSLQRKI